MSQGQSAPRRNLETLHAFQCQTTLQLMDEQICNGSVALVDHVETVGPAGPKALWLVRAALRKPHPPYTNGSGAVMRDD